MPSPELAEGPAGKSKAQEDYEAFRAFEVLRGNFERLDERLEEARAYQPEDPEPSYSWNGFP